MVNRLNGKVKVAAQLEVWDSEYSVPQDTDVLINATSIGMGDATARVELEVDSLGPSLIVADVVVNPPHTRLLTEAAGRGCTTLDGLGMLVNQAVISFQIWTGIEPDPAVMREALEEFLEL